VTNSQSVADQFAKMDWKAIFADELKIQPQKGDNEAINHMTQLVFDLRKKDRVHQESQQFLKKENEMLKHELQLQKDKMAKS
jgi:hypothetical protein